MEQKTIGQHIDSLLSNIKPYANATITATKKAAKVFKRELKKALKSDTGIRR